VHRILSFCSAHVCAQWRGGKKIHMYSRLHILPPHMHTHSPEHTLHYTHRHSHTLTTITHTNSPPHKFTHIVQHTLLPNITVSDPPQSQVVSRGSHQIWELTSLESKAHNRYVHIPLQKINCSKSRIHSEISCYKMYIM